jgi:nucleoside-diphosphate-sugar epimerase
MEPILFLTGASGYIGGTFLTLFHQKHPQILVRALVRTSEQAERLREFYQHNVEPVLGSMQDFELLSSEASKASIVVQGSGNEREGIIALINGIAINPANSSTSLRPVFIHISGSSNVTDPQLPMGDCLPKAYSDVDDLEEILAFGPERNHVTLENKIRELSEERNVQSLILAPPTILGHGLGAMKTETFQVQWYNTIIELGTSFLTGKGENVWSVISIRDLGEALVFFVEEALKGENSRLRYGRDGYYFIEAFEVKLMERAQAIGERLSKEGKIKTKNVKLIPAKELEDKLGSFFPYLVGSSSRCRADKLKGLGWKPKQLDWRVLVEEHGGIRC